MSYPGMSNTTGRTINDLDHIRQSIRDILTTPLGARLMRRDYGSLLPALIDQPLNGATRLRVMAASVMAIRKWEPRIAITRIAVTLGSTAETAGSVAIALEGTRTDGARNAAVSLLVPVTGSAA